MTQSRILTPTIHRKQAHLQSHTTNVREWEVHWPAKVLSGSNSGCRQASGVPLVERGSAKLLLSTYYVSEGFLGHHPAPWEGSQPTPLPGTA